MKKSTLLRQTLLLLDRDPRPLLEIHQRSGISFYWIRKLKAREIKEPSVTRTQALYEFLSGRQLDVS